MDGEGGCDVGDSGASPSSSADLHPPTWRHQQALGLAIKRRAGGRVTPDASQVCTQTVCDHSSTHERDKQAHAEQHLACFFFLVMYADR